MGATDVSDINNDGTDDLILGAPFADPTGRTNAGETYVIFGPLPSGTLELSAAADVTIKGMDSQDSSGSAVAGADINHDGKDDLLISARHADPGAKTDAGEAYVLYGLLGTGTFELTLTADVNNDGLMDIIIGAPEADPSGRTDAGETYVLLGDPPDKVLEIDTWRDITINGIDADDRAGFVAVGDVNNDGVDDLVVGAPSANAGEVYVVFGPLTSGRSNCPPMPTLPSMGTTLTTDLRP